MQMEKKYAYLLALLCVVFVLFAFSYVDVSPRPSFKTVHQPGNRLRDDCCSSGFVLVLHYTGQQGAAVRAVNSVQKWIKDVGLSMMIVEPFMQDSRMGVCQKKKREKQGVKFSDVFDMDSFNAVSRSEGFPEMVAWSEYITNAPREAVFINFVSIDGDDNSQPPTIQLTNSNGSNKCTVRTITAPDNTSISLCHVREATAYWKFGDTHILSHEDIYGTILKDLDLANFTIIFSNWRGPWHLATHSQAAHNDDSSTDVDYKFQDSPKLRHYMETYQNEFLTAPGERESRYVAVMIRAEHTVRQLMWNKLKGSKMLAKIKECLYELQNETNEAMRAVGARNLLVTSDVGYYGSGTWYQTVKVGNVTDIQDIVKRGVERLYEGREGWSFEQWEQSFIAILGGVTDRGYVAALQRVLATSSKAACLVLMGGGRFQQLSLEHYLHHTRHQPHTRCTHLLCMEKQYAKLFSSIIKNS